MLADAELHGAGPAPSKADPDKAHLTARSTTAVGPLPLLLAAGRLRRGRQPSSGGTPLNLEREQASKVQVSAASESRGMESIAADGCAPCHGRMAARQLQLILHCHWRSAALPATITYNPHAV
jgi:hypothetical protein